MTSAAKELGMVRVLVLGVGPRCAEGTRSLEQGGPLPSRWCNCSSSGPRQIHASFPPVRHPPLSNHIVSCPFYLQNISQICPFLSAASITSTWSQLLSLPVWTLGKPSCLSSRHPMASLRSLLLTKARVRSLLGADLFMLLPS